MPNLLPKNLRELGYVHGETLILERRFADGQLDRLSRLAREVVQLPVDVVVAIGTEATLAAKDATATIPITMVVASDPVARGWVASLSRPGGNISGVMTAA